jgi:putative ABC transport system permease protein
MMMYLSLVWRNIWRNRRRSAISMGSVMFAVLIALVMRSMQLGFYGRSIDNVVSFYTGYIEIHEKGYNEEQSVDLSFAASDSLLSAVRRTPGVTKITPRLESFALVSTSATTDGALIVGIDPAAEDRFTGLAGRVSAGRYLEDGDSGILLADGLASHLGAAVGDTVVALGQGYHGLTAVGKYPVVGLAKFPINDLNSGAAFLTLPEAGDLTGAEGRLTSLAVMLHRQRDLARAARRLRADLGPSFEVLTWDEILPELVQLIEWDNAGGLIMLAIIYVVIGFGILGTVLMMTMERTREFGMLISIGMSRLRLQAVVTIESAFLSFVGALTGALVSIPVIVHFHAHPLHLSGTAAQATIRFGFEPVMPFLLSPDLFLNQGLVVLGIALIASLYPAIRIAALDPVAALRRA